MVIREYVMGYQLYGYKGVCDGMSQLYGYKGVCDGICPLIRIHYPSDRLYFHSSIAVIRHQSQFDRLYFHSLIAVIRSYI